MQRNSRTSRSDRKDVEMTKHAGGRPRKKDAKTSIITVGVDVELKTTVVEYAEMTGKTVSSAMRDLLLRGLNQVKIERN